MTDDDVFDFASDSKAKGRVLKPVSKIHVSGFATEFVDRNRYWREWWLKGGAGATLVYVTYNISLASKDKETEPIEQMINSIAITD